MEGFDALKGFRLDSDHIEAMIVLWGMASS